MPVGFGSTPPHNSVISEKVEHFRNNLSEYDFNCWFDPDRAECDYDVARIPVSLHHLKFHDKSQGNLPDCRKTGFFDYLKNDHEFIQTACRENRALSAELVVWLGWRQVDRASIDYCMKLRYERPPVQKHRWRDWSISTPPERSADFFRLNAQQRSVFEFVNPIGQSRYYDIDTDTAEEDEVDQEDLDTLRERNERAAKRRPDDKFITRSNAIELVRSECGTRALLVEQSVDGQSRKWAISNSLCFNDEIGVNCQFVIIMIYSTESLVSNSRI